MTSRITTIVKELEQVAVEISRLAEEGARQAEIEHQKWKAQCDEWERKQQEEQAAKALQDSKDELLKIIGAWSQSMQLQAFFVDAEKKIAQLPNEERERMFARLKRARELTGSIDALERFHSWRAPEER